MEILSKIVYSFILACSLLYIWHKLIDKKIQFKSVKLYVTLFGITIISLFNYFMVNKFIKITLITIVFMFFFKYLFKEKLNKCILTPIFYQLIIMISELTYALIIIMLKIDINLTINSLLINMISNIIISIISILIVKLRIIKKLYKKLLEISDKINNVQLLILCLCVMLLSNILAMSVYYRIKFEYLLIFNVAMTIMIFSIIFYYLKTKSNYDKVSNKYNVAINSLKDYEDMMNKYRIANHENKNLLLTIRAMILNKEKDIPKYIDSIVENKYDDDEKLLFEMSVIPTGGLRATIYSEILKIKNNNIKYSLIIDNNISTLDLIELDKNTIIDICKIIGVFIDNAIEEVKKLTNKDIQINLFLENDSLNIKVSNYYKSPISLEMLYKEGYTTKGKNHGYGLSLVKNIIESNELLDNVSQISKNLFSQILIIKYKNKKSH